MFQSIFSTINEGLVIQHGKAQITTLNPAAERMLGLAAAELIGQPADVVTGAVKLIHENGTAFSLETLPAIVAARTGMPVGEVVIGVYRPDGTLVWLSANSQPLIAQGASAPYPVATILRDIPGRERGLDEGEKRQRLLEHRKLIQTSLDGFWVARTKDARILEANEAFCSMVGYSRAELLTMCIADLEANESPAETAAHIKKVMAVGYDRFETRHRHKQGYLVDLEVSTSYSKMNGGEFFVFVRDITARKRTEDALYFVAQRGWMDSAENFFDALAQYLGETLGVDYVVIDRLDKDPGIAATVALYAQGAIVPNMRYDLKGTPCENVMGRKFCFYPQGIQQLFPDDALLVKMGVESYAGLPLWDSSGQPIGLIAVMDGKPLPDEASVSKLLQFVALRAAAELERERSDRTLRERERKFRTLAESMPDNIVRYNREGVTVYVNPVLERTLGDSAAAMLGTTPREYHPDGAYEDYAQLLDAVLASGEAGELERVLNGPDGTTSVHQIRMVPERGENGEVVGVLAIGHDITERKRMEESLVNRERELRALAESSPGMMGSFYLRPDASICMPYVSPKIRELFGLTPQDVAADATPLLARTHPDDVQMVQESIAESARTLTTWHVAYRILHPSKGERWMESNTNPEPHPGGGVIWYGYVHDVTERKQAERQLRELTAHLQSVREEEIARLAREIHDDLGSALAALNLRLSHLLDFEFSEDMKKMPLFARLESMSQILESAIAAMRRIITDMRPDILDNLGLFAALKWQAEQFNKRTGIECRVICAHDHGCKDCKNCDYILDPMLSINLFRIFQEALSNVARHSGASSVAAEYRPGNGDVLLSISDNGCGLPVGHAPSSASFGMRGMRERVGQLGGQIKFASALGGGLCVTVRLPCAIDSTGIAERR